MQSELRGSLKVFGLKIGKVSKKEFASRAPELAEDQPALTAIVKPLLKLRAEVIKQLDVLHRIVLNAAKNDEMCRRWRRSRGGVDLSQCHRCAGTVREITIGRAGPWTGAEEASTWRGQLPWPNYQAWRRDDQNPASS